MLDYALDLSDVKTRGWFRSTLDQGSHETIRRVGVQAKHKITGISMLHLPFGKHVDGGIPTIGFLIRSQLAGFMLKPNHLTQVRDRQGNQVTDFNWQQKNTRPRVPDEKSIYVLNSDELEGMIEAGGYDDQEAFMRRLRDEVADQVYTRSTELQLVKFKAPDPSNRRYQIGVSDNQKKNADVWYVGARTSEVCPKFSEKLTDNDFTFITEAAFEDMADERQDDIQAGRVPATADVKLVEDQPQLLTNMLAHTPEKLAANQYASSYQASVAAKSGVSPALMGNVGSALSRDAAMFQHSGTNPYDTLKYAESKQGQVQKSSASEFQTGVDSGSEDKNIHTAPLHMKGQLHLGSSAINSEIDAEAQADSGAHRDKNISRKPLSMTQELDLRNNTIKYNSVAEDDEDEDDDETSSMRSLVSSEAEDEDEAEETSSETETTDESTSNTRSSSKAAEYEDEESSESSQNSSLAEEADEDSSDEDSTSNRSMNGDYLRSRAASQEEANNERDINNGGLGR